MTAPRLIARIFDGRGVDDRYRRMARVLAHTAAQQNPTWTIDVQTIEPPPRPSALRIASHEANTQKLEAWDDAVQAAADGDRLLLVDGDTAIVGPLDDLWAMPFDVAYTLRPADCPLPFNAGVIALRVSEASRAWMSAWRGWNARMLADASLHKPYRARYGGMNQAALGALLEQPRSSLLIAGIPCAIWNCEETAWATFDPAVTRILHVKSLLRLAIFDGDSAAAPIAHVVAWWRARERETRAAAA